MRLPSLSLIVFSGILCFVLILILQSIYSLQNHHFAYKHHYTRIKTHLTSEQGRDEPVVPKSPKAPAVTKTQRKPIPRVKGDILKLQNHNNHEQYAYGVNRTDHRKDFIGQSLFPELQYHIGVLSTAKFIKTRVNDLYHTWGKEAQSINVYIGQTDEHYNTDVSVIQLKEVNDSSYPPQAKGFKLIKYWCDNLLHQYDWFIKADDDTYVKVAHMENFLWSLDPNKKHFIGRFGKGLPHEIHLLGLDGNSFCCGPTVIYSKPLLKALCPHIDQCLSEVVSEHEDTEITRCVVSRVGLQCAHNNHDSIPEEKRLRRLFYQTYDRSHFMGDLNTQTKVENAITVHEVKHSSDMYNLHYYYRLHMASNFTKVPYKSNPYKITERKATSKTNGRTEKSRKE